MFERAWARYTKQELQLLRKMRKQGKPTRAIAQALGRSSSGITRKIRNSELPRWSGKGPSKHTAEHCFIIWREHDERGWSYKVIAGFLNMTINQVRGIVHRERKKQAKQQTLSSDGRLRSEYNVYGTVTGRLK